MSIDVVTSPKRHLRIQLSLCHSGSSPKRSTGGRGRGAPYACSCLGIARPFHRGGAGAGSHIDPCRPMGRPMGQPMSTHVDPCRPMSTHVVPCRSMSTHVVPCRPMSSHVDPCRPMSSHGAAHVVAWGGCRPMSTHVDRCRSMSTDVDRCRSMSIDVVTSLNRHWPLAAHIGPCRQARAPSLGAMPAHVYGVAPRCAAHCAMSTPMSAPMSTHVVPCRPMSTHVDRCRSMSIDVDRCRSMSIDVVSSPNGRWSWRPIWTSRPSIEPPCRPMLVRLCRPMSIQVHVVYDIVSAQDDVVDDM